MATYNGHNEDSSGNILLSIGNGMTAKVETGTTASQAYTKGALLFFNNRLCKATKAISSGATLAVGTNLSQTSLGAELTSHLRSSDGKEFYFDVKDGTYGYYPSASKVSSEFVPFGGTMKNIVFHIFGQIPQGNWATGWYYDATNESISMLTSNTSTFDSFTINQASPATNSATITITNAIKLTICRLYDGTVTTANYNAGDKITIAGHYGFVIMYD